MGFFSGRSKPSHQDSGGWITHSAFVGDLYDRRWFERGRATSRVQRNGIEMSDPIPPGLRLIDDAEESKRFFTRLPREREVEARAAREYFKAKVLATAENLSFTIDKSHIPLVLRMVFTVLKWDGMMLLDNFHAHPALRQQYSVYVSSIGDDDVISLLAWWIALSNDDPAGGTSMWLHMSMDKGIRLGFEEAGALPRRDS